MKIAPDEIAYIAQRNRLLSLQRQFEHSRDACYERAALTKANHGAWYDDAVRAEVWGLAARCLANAIAD